MRIYLDSAPIIYTVERVTPFDQAVNQRLTTAGIVIVSSELVRMECLVLPFRNQNATRVAGFDTRFSLQVAEMVPFTPAVFRRAAEVRATENFRTPDALHLAAAVEAACDVYLTNDAKLARFAGLSVEVV